VNVLRPGVWGVLPTPFEATTLDVDAASLTKVVNAYRQLGGRDVVPGVVALGVFGEAARLSADERERVLATVVSTAGDLEVVAGIPFAAPDLARDEAARLAGAVRGVRALLVQVSSADTAILVRDLTRVHEASGRPVDPATATPQSWRDYVARRTGRGAPELMTEGEAPGYLRYDSGTDPADPVDQAIGATRRAVFPEHGLYP